MPIATRPTAPSNSPFIKILSGIFFASFQPEAFRLNQRSARHPLWESIIANLGGNGRLKNATLHTQVNSQEVNEF
jgi:hypothetical protein